MMDWLIGYAIGEALDEKSVRLAQMLADRLNDRKPDAFAIECIRDSIRRNTQARLWLAEQIDEPDFEPDATYESTKEPLMAPGEYVELWGK